MLKRILLIVLALLVACLAYLLLWPVPIDPVAWDAPENPGYAGPYAPNDRLAGLRRVPLDGRTGPEDAATGPDGDVFISTGQGEILRMDSATGAISAFAKTGGRPLGIEFGPDGRLFVADAYRGLLAIDEAGKVTVLTDKDGAGAPIRYADDLDIASDGTIYFSDASAKFGAEANGGTLPASLLDLMEHGGHGRVLRYDPAAGSVKTVLDGLQFANGVALAKQALLIVETGSYRVVKLWLEGDRAGDVEVLLDNLPGFPDNLNRARDGTFWLGLASPRSPALDALSGSTFLRKVVQRLPAALRPKEQHYGFVIHFDESGNILETLQDPAGDYSLTTGAAEGPDKLLIITSLTEDSVGLLAR